jgi:hypothetical protein
MSYIPINPASLFDSPVFTGDPTAPTPSPGDNDNSLATTAFVTSAVVAGGAFVDAPSDGSLYGRRNAGWTKAAPLNSPALTGDPTAPTPTAGDNDTSIATTAFVAAAITASGGGGAPPATVPPLMDGTAAVGTATKYAREDHVHPSDTSLAPLASPTFTGIPAAPTAVGGTSTTQLATTAFVQAAISAGGTFIDAPSDGSLYGRLNAGWTKAAPLNSPVLTGTPAAPTAAPGTNTTQLATTAYATAADTALKAAIVGTASTSMDTLGEIETYISANITPALGNKADLFSPTFTGDPKAPTPTAGDNDTSIATTAFVTGAIATAGAGYQPLDADLTAIAALSGTNNIYYRSAANTWSSVTIGTGLSFSAGTLANTVSGVTPAALTRVSDTNVTLTLGGTPATALLQATSITAGWTGTLSAARGGFGVDASAANGVALWASGVPTFTSTTGTGTLVRSVDPVLTGNPTAPTPTAGDNDTSIATTAFVTTAVAAAPAILSSTWLAGASPNNSTIFIAPRALTITSLVGVVEIANGAAATVSVVKAASGTALASGTVIHSGSFNANGTAATNQTLTLTTTTMASGDRLGITTTGTFTNSIASITVTVK